MSSRSKYFLDHYWSDRESTIYAIDFDGVIHNKKSPWVSDKIIDGEPFGDAINWMNTLDDFYIFTTRGRTAEGRLAVRHWLRNNGLLKWKTVQIIAKPFYDVIVDDKSVNPNIRASVER